MEIQSARCIIRRFEDKDIDDFMLYRNDMNWMKYQGFKGLSRKEYARELLKELSFEDGFQLAIICKETNKLIGDIYLKGEADNCWIGYSINPLESRQGFAYETVLAVITFLRKKGINSFKAGVVKGNLASTQLLKKLGFSYEGIEFNEEIFSLVF